VCGALSLSHICKILSRFSPDELSPESVRPELLDTLSSEVSDLDLALWAFSVSSLQLHALVKTGVSFFFVKFKQLKL
jgi:hypothetical protein